MRKRTHWVSTRIRVSQHPFWRAVAWIVLIGQVSLGLPPAVEAATATATADDQPQQAQPAAPPVHVNRTVPKVTPPSAKPTFSAQPTDAEITNARVFGEPLMKIGRGTLPGENRALVTAITSYLDAHSPEVVLSFLGFLKTYPDSPWRASLLLNLGLVYRHTGYFLRALEVWEQTWQSTKTATDPAGKAIGDRALGELVELNARLGRFERLEALFAETKDRVVSGHATEQVTAAREGLWMMRNQPEKAFLCGPLAVDSLLAATRAGYIRDQKIRDAKSTQQGTSLAQMQRLAAKLNLPLQMVHRDPGAAVLLPAVVHWKAGHFAALIREADGRFLIRDPTFGDELWVSRTALDEEATGYMLVQLQSWPAGWRLVDQSEGEQIWGKGQTDGNDPDRTQQCDIRSRRCGGGRCLGMAEYAAHLMVVSLNLEDTPISYTTPRGVAMGFSVTYNQREAHQPTAFTFSNLGPKWTYDWLSYVEDDPTNPNATASLTVRGGGRDLFQGFNPATQSYQPEPRQRSILVRISSTPIRYERRLSNGSVDIFAQPDGGSAYPRRVFLTESHDPQGNTVSFTYDAQLRLIAATDALGQVTTLSYDNVTDTRKITRVTDPFGRIASFDYDASGRLTRITDMIGLQSAFTYDAGDFITGLTTPYGTSTFVKGENGASRWLEMTDPLGGKERIEYQVNSAVAATDPPERVPTNVGVSNNYLNYRNTFYWDKRAMSLAPRDPASAHRYHWLHTGGPLNQTSGTLESEQALLEGRVWYRYPDQPSSITEGSSDRPSMIARVLDDGSTQASFIEYNTQGNVTKKIDPLGRTSTLVYASNGIDLLEVRQTTSGMNELVTAYANYTTQHWPQDVTDAAGQLTHISYNAHGQILTVTNAKSETTTYSYDPSGDGYLQSVVGPILSATISYSYDGFGRQVAVTDVDGYTKETAYDAMNRVTRQTYPDGSYEETIYNRLDPIERRDRLGRATRFFFDPQRRLVAVRDPLGRTITQLWCACGSLDVRIDARGQRTHWDHDLQGRVTSEVRGDGAAITTYNYEATTSRLASLVDAKGQHTGYTYNLDDTLHSFAFSDAAIATPSVAYTYDASYNRLATMLDGTGLTTYTYKPVGSLGGLQLASIDGPLSNDTISYEYDSLGRVATRDLNGAVNRVSQTYDSLGRTTSETNALGEFDYGYDGATSFVESVGYPNGQTKTFTYYDNLGDRRLQTIHNKYPGGSTLSRFDYTYDKFGNILSQQQQADAGTPTTWTYTYDAADQLVTAEQQATSPASVLKRFAYAYDPAANRVTEQIDDVVRTSTYDGLNRLLGRGRGGDIRVTGTVSEPASVSIQGRPAVLTPDNFFTGTAPTTAGANTLTIVATDLSGNSQTQQYSVDLGSETSQTLQYDANGNLTSDGTRVFEWDARNQLVAITTGTHRSEFTYDGVQRRVREIEKEGGVVQSDIRVLWCGPDICEERAADGVTVMRRAFAAGEQVAGVARFFATDRLESVTEVTDGTATLLARYTFDPWGTRLTVAGTDVTRVGFTGHRQAGTLSLTWFRAYDASLGRWLSEDPAARRFWARPDLEVDNPNRYEYALNSPVRYSDPLGLDVADALAQIGTICWTGARIGAGILGAAVGVMLSQCGDGCNPNGKCKPCEPPVGTVAYRVDDGPDARAHRGVPTPHWHAYRMNQSPYPVCKCFWVPLPDAKGGFGPGQPPPGTPQMGPAGGGGPR